MKKISKCNLNFFCVSHNPWDAFLYDLWLPLSPEVLSPHQLALTHPATPLGTSRGSAVITRACFGNENYNSDEKRFLYKSDKSSFLEHTARLQKANKKVNKQINKTLLTE